MVEAERFRQKLKFLSSNFRELIRYEPNARSKGLLRVDMPINLAAWD